MKVVSSEIYCLNPVIAIEDFTKHSLALHCIDLRLVELNATAREIVSRLDGEANLQQVANSIAQNYDQPLEVVLDDVQKTIIQLATLGLVERVSPGKTPPQAIERLSIQEDFT